VRRTGVETDPRDPNETDLEGSAIHDGEFVEAERENSTLVAQVLAQKPEPVLRASHDASELGQLEELDAALESEEEARRSFRERAWLRLSRRAA
jgi:hypothetical protein